MCHPHENCHPAPRLWPNLWFALLTTFIWLIIELVLQAGCGWLHSREVPRRFIATTDYFVDEHCTPDLEVSLNFFCSRRGELSMFSASWVRRRSCRVVLTASLLWDMIRVFWCKWLWITGDISPCVASVALSPAKLISNEMRWSLITQDQFVPMNGQLLRCFVWQTPLQF